MAVWQDGAYLQACPRLMRGTSYALFIIGFIEGLMHWIFYTLWDGRAAHETAVSFIQMVPLLYLAVIAGTFGSRFGVLLVAGFALGDWFFGPEFRDQGLPLLTRIVRLGAAQIASYLVVGTRTGEQPRPLAASNARLGGGMSGGGAGRVSNCPSG